MPEQIFQLVERNLEARQLTADNYDELVEWCHGYPLEPDGEVRDGYVNYCGSFVVIGAWLVRLFDNHFILVSNEAFRKHFTSPRLPWHPQPPMPHWYRGPSFADGHPLTINVKP